MKASTRRQFLGLTATAFASWPLLQACSDGSHAPGADPSRKPTVRNQTLRVGWVEKEFPGPGPNGKIRVRLRAYDGQVPGPTLELVPGDRLNLTIDNQLTPYDSSLWNGDHNTPHDLNTTNLHTHGLEVIPHLFEPLGTTDPAASMIAIAPGQSYTYGFTIPENHPAGLFWYHPHHHGSTAVQAVSGMAGLIVVRGAIDDVPEIAQARDVRLAVTDIGLFPSDDTEGVWTYEPKQNAIWSTFGNGVVVNDPTTGKATPRPDLKGGFTTGDYLLRYYAVNGTPVFRESHNFTDGQQNKPLGEAIPDGIPTIALRPGEVIRVRMLNGCSDLAMPLSLAGMPIHLIALDGTNFPAPRTLVTQEPAKGQPWDGVVTYGTEATTLVLAPGNRAEFLLKGDTPGTFELVQVFHTGVQFLEAERKVLARVVVGGEPLPMKLPATLPTSARHQSLIKESDIIERREVRFGANFPAVTNKAVGLDFMLNDKLYSEARIDAQVRVNTAEAWTLVGHAHDGSEGHPFHIHVNPFEVKRIGNRAQPPGTFMDTVWVPPNEKVEVWMRFVGWTGKAVYHCHILPHEDTGMMQNLLITD